MNSLLRADAVPSSTRRSVTSLGLVVAVRGRQEFFHCVVDRAVAGCQECIEVLQWFLAELSSQLTGRCAVTQLQSCAYDNAARNTATPRSTPGNRDGSIHDTMEILWRLEQLTPNPMT